MPNPTPLNPEALEAASREVFREVLGFDKTQSARVARRAVSAYLAVAEPGQAEARALQKAQSDAGWLENMDRQGGA